MIFHHPRLICAYSRRPQNMSLVYGDTWSALENRKQFLTFLGIDYRQLVCAQQVHGSQVRCAREADRGKGALSYASGFAHTDSLITNKISVPLAIFTADCLSIFLYDPNTSSIGLVHAGWRSTQENITLKTVQLMQKEFNINPKDLSVGFGPSIRDCCYHLDLVGINKKQLRDLGIKEANIFDSGICTSCRNAEFFSYRKEGNSCGRMISVMMLKG